MNTFISILRGINVSGKKRIKMADLQNLYEELGFRSVTTFIQSGNVVFKTKDLSLEKMEQMISQQIKKDFRFEVPIIVMTLDQLKQTINKNPFISDPEKIPSFLHVTFLSSKPAPYAKETIERKKRNGEEIIFSENVIYLYCPNGYGKTKLTNNFLESKIKVAATTRNWKTLNELLRIACQMEP